MKEYHKIQTLFKRDPATNFSKVIEGEFSLPVFNYLKDNIWEFTEKIDGTNIRIMWDGEETISFGGKTDNAHIPSFLVNRLNVLFTKEMMSTVFPQTPACLYGEGFGARIQKGGGNYIAKDVDFILFDVRIGRWWLKRQGVSDVAKCLSIRHVPIVGLGNIYEMVELVKLPLKSAFGMFPAEGIVARPVEELLLRSGERVITKLKVKDF